MNLWPEKEYRRFLLGIANEEEECRLEEAVLVGEVDDLFLLDAEDELIDDYILGSMTREESQGFSANFLSTDERREKLAFAAGLIGYARNQQAKEHSVGRKPSQRAAIRAVLSWRQTALLAAAASVLFAALAGFEQLQLHRQAQVSSETRDELTRLQAARAQGDGESSPFGGPSRSAPTSPQDAPDRRQVLEFLPSIRGVVATPLLHIPAQAQYVGIDLKLSLPLGVEYREVILQMPSGEEIWAQKFPVSNFPAAQQATIVLPAPILPKGFYHFQIESASVKGRFKPSGDYVFQVVRE